MVNRKSCCCGFLWDVNSPTQTWNFDLPEQKVQISHIFRFTWVKSRDLIHFRFTCGKSTDFPHFRFTDGPDLSYFSIYRGKKYWFPMISIYFETRFPAFFRFTSQSNFNLLLIKIRATVDCQFSIYFPYRFQFTFTVRFEFTFHARFQLVMVDWNLPVRPDG